MTPRLPRGWLLASLATVILLLGATRPVDKYLPFPALLSVAMLIVGGCLYWRALQIVDDWARAGSPLLKLDRVAIGSVLAVATAVSAVIYPLANVLRGNTADDALILAASSFLNSGSMYGSTLPGGVPISPGPGWVLLNLPLANPTTYFLLAPVHMAITVLACGLTFRTTQHVALCLVLVATSPLFWELVAQGHDVVPLGFALATASVLTYRLAARKDAGIAAWIPVGVLVGLVATSRVVFALFPVVLAAASWRVNRLAALTIGATGLLLTLALHVGFWQASAYYQPAHLFYRGSATAGWPLITVGLVASGVSLIYAYRSGASGAAGWLRGVSIGLAVPLTGVSLADLRATGFELARWEGANYLFPFVPLSLLAIAVALLGARAVPDRNPPAGREAATGAVEST